MCYPPQNPTTYKESYIDFLINEANQFLRKKDKAPITLGQYNELMNKCKDLLIDDKDSAYELLKQTTAWIDFFQELKGYLQKQYLDCENEELYLFHDIASKKSPSNIAAGERAAHIDSQINTLRKEKSNYKALVDVITGKIEVLNKAHYMSKLVMTNDKNYNP